MEDPLGIAVVSNITPKKIERRVFNKPSFKILRDKTRKFVGKKGSSPGKRRRSSINVHSISNSVENDRTPDSPSKIALEEYIVPGDVFNVAVYETATKELMREMNEQKSLLQDQISRLSSESEEVRMQAQKLHGYHNMDIESIRKNAIINGIRSRKQIKALRKGMKITQDNIMKICSFLDRTNSMMERSDSVASFSTDKFIHKALLSPRTKESLIRIREIEPPKITLNSIIDPRTKSGRIIARYEERLEKLEYDDVLVILDAIGPTDANRTLLFDICYTQFLYPFADVPIMSFPPILEFPSNIFEQEITSLSIPFDCLGGTDWKFKFTESYLFEILIQTDPFRIAELFSDMVHKIAEVIDNPDVGFDELFIVTLTSVLSFGVPEILEFAKYAVSFKDYVTTSSQEYGIQFMESILYHLKNLDIPKLRLKMML